MILVGFLGYAFLASLTSLIMVDEPHAQTNYYQITALPLFILMGTVVRIRISKDLMRLLEWIMCAVAGHGDGACGLGGCVVVIIATADNGKIAHPEMRRYNYDDRLSSSAIAAGGRLAFDTSQHGIYSLCAAYRAIGGPFIYGRCDTRHP